MNGRTLVGILLGMSLGLGGLTYYYQNYAYYQPVTLDAPVVAVNTPVQPAVTQPGPDTATETPLAQPDAATPSVPAALGDPGAPGEPDVDTTELPPPDTGDDVAQTDAPGEIPSADTDAKSDGTTPIDPDAALATQLPEAADNIRVATLKGATAIRLTRVWDNGAEIIDAADFKGIDAKTSPLKFKGCFKVSNSIPMMTETYVVYADPTPIKAPLWFTCYRHKRLSADIESGEAVAFLGEANIFYGVDRVVAVYGDGRAYVWHQVNECGVAAYAGNDLPNGCPPKPER